MALLLLHDARRNARLGPDGEAVTLPEQDRARWDHDGIRGATELLERALTSDYLTLLAPRARRFTGAGSRW